jgi:hypothetical protein
MHATTNEHKSQVHQGSSWGSGCSSRFMSNQAEMELAARSGSHARLDALLQFARLFLANHARRRAMPQSQLLLNNQHQCHTLHSSEFTLSEEFNSGSNGRRLTARAWPDPTEQDNQPFSPKSNPLSCPNPSWSIRIISQRWGSACLQNPIPVRMLVLASNSLNAEPTAINLSLSLSLSLSCHRMPVLVCFWIKS